MCVIATATLAVAQPSPPPDPNKIQVLILTGQHVHDWRNTTPILKQILESTGKFEVRVNEEFRGAGPETLANYGLVVVNYYNRGDKDRWESAPTERSKRSSAQARVSSSITSRSELDMAGPNTRR